MKTRTTPPTRRKGLKPGKPPQRRTELNRGTSQLKRTGRLPRVRKGKERNGHDRSKRNTYVAADDRCEYGRWGICICRHRKGEKLTAEHFMRRNEHMTDEPWGLLRICEACHRFANADTRAKKDIDDSTAAKIAGHWIKLNEIRKHTEDDLGMRLHLTGEYIENWRTTGFNIEEVRNWVDVEYPNLAPDVIERGWKIIAWTGV